MERLISLFGLVVMIALAFAMSADRRKVDRRLVVAGVGLPISSRPARPQDWTRTGAFRLYRRFFHRPAQLRRCWL